MPQNNDNSGYKILNLISSSQDVKPLPSEDIKALCEEIRGFLLENISRTGGHLASNLGVVELTVALHRVFDSRSDRLIFDVGHQSYVHKILTGRRDQFSTLRSFGGLSGFSSPSESCDDAFVSGHASTSVSVALGMARARTLNNDKHHVVCVIGDGALTGGMAYEALNDAAQSGEPLIIILNDNDMSITKNVGAIAKRLSHLRIKPVYFRFKALIRNNLMRFKNGEYLFDLIARAKDRAKSVLLPKTIFEHLGFTYFGPVDGHNISLMCHLFDYAISLKEPVVIHVKTVKGKGYCYSEANPGLYHGVAEFDIDSGECVNNHTEPIFSHAFGNAMCELAERDDSICAITAAMTPGTGLTRFSRKFPKRFFDVGIAEEHAVTMASAMAKSGLRPVFAVYSTFLQRSYDQLIHDASILGLHVVFAIDRAGIVGEDGETHNGVFDIAFLSSIPGMTIFCPSGTVELKNMLRRALYHTTGPVAIRYPRGGEGDFKTDTSASDAVILQNGTDITVISYGIMINKALSAAQKLNISGVSAEIIKVNRIDRTLPGEVMDSLKKTGNLLVLEDCVAKGSYGEQLSCAIMQSAGGHKFSMRLMNIGDRFLPAGSPEDIYAFANLSEEDIVKTSMELINKT